MSDEGPLYDELTRRAAQGAPAEVLQALSEALASAHRYPELFEARKLQLRLRLGLPLLATPLEQLDDELQQAYEEGLLAACREVGMGLLVLGRIREGWPYLRPVGNHREVLATLGNMTVASDQVDQWIELLLHEGLDVAWGFRLILTHFGTCNAITAFQSALYGRSRAQRAEAAGLLVEHIYQELLLNIRSHAERVGEPIAEANASQPLLQILVAHPNLCQQGTYHIDTTHLSTVVTLAREVTDLRQLEMAYELTVYGSMLDANYQYEGEPPFELTYASHQLWLAAQLNRDVWLTTDVTNSENVGKQNGELIARDELAARAIGYFRQRAESVEPRYDGTQVIEFYLDLLSRLGRFAESFEEQIRLIPAGIHTTGWAPSLLELAQRAGNYQRAIEVARERHELLGFVIGLLAQSGQPLTADSTPSKTV